MDIPPQIIEDILKIKRDQYGDVNLSKFCLAECLDNPTIDTFGKQKDCFKECLARNLKKSKKK